MLDGTTSRQIALQLCAQLPDNLADALGILSLAGAIMTFLASQAPDAKKNASAATVVPLRGNLAGPLQFADENSGQAIHLAIDDPVQGQARGDVN